VKKLSKENQQFLDCWRRNEGVAEPKRRQGAPVGNLKPMTHGIFANKCLDEEERVLFQEVIGRLYQDFEFNRSSDFIQIEFIAINTVKYMRSIQDGNMDAAQKLDTMIRAHMKDLKATKITREADQPKRPQTTPADWAAELLKKSGNSRRPGRANGPKRPKRAKNAKKMASNTVFRDSPDPREQGRCGDRVGPRWRRIRIS
jgi:hypothetical protein